MEPALIALLLTVGSGFLLRFIEHMMDKNVKGLAALPPSPALESGKKPEAYECEVYSERLLDEKMVAANIMTLSDMAVCENLECPNCLPSRPKIVLPDYKQKRNAAEDIIRQNSAQKKRLLSDVRTKMQNRGIEINPRPPEVPEYASRTTVYDPSYMRDFIYWKWVDSDGRVRGLKQLIAPRIDTETYWK